MNKIVEIGNKGENVRSDCFLKLELKNSGGIKINLQSKIKILYGSKILSLFEDMFNFFGIRHALLDVEDTGSLDFVLAARLEIGRASCRERV